MDELEEEKVLLGKAISVYDDQPDEKYYPAHKYIGLKGNVKSFVVKSILAARRYDVIVLGHINLAIVGAFVKRLFPAKKLILITHGIEVWDELSGVKKQVIEKVDKILSVSSFTKNKIVEVHGVDESKIEVYPNTIDPYFPQPENLSRDTALRARYNIKEDDFLMYTLTRLSSAEQYKGYDRVIAAMHKVVQANNKVKYIIAGKYDEQEKKKLDGLIEQYGLQNNVQIIGFIKEEELIGHYQMADLYIMPSKNEGFGIVFIEALVCGVPVVAGNADGTTDALQGGETGTLVNPDSIEEIQQAILSSSQKDLRNDLVAIKHNKQKTIDMFSFASYKERLKNIILSC